MKQLLPILALMGQKEFWPKPKTQEQLAREEDKIRDEYKLIQLKKSKLSKRSRDNVVWKYNRLGDK